MAAQDILNSISRRVVLFAGIGLILVLLVATIVVLAVLRKEALDRAEWHFGNLAMAIGEQTWQSVHTLELLGKTTADELKDRYAEKRPLSDGEFTKRLKERIAALPDARMLSFVDTRGDVLLHVPAPAPPGANFADREHFQAHLARRVDGPYVGAPVVGRLMNEWLDVFSFRVEDGRGELKGVVMLAVAMTYFQRLFAALDLGAGGRVLLFRDDGVLLATDPPEERAYGRSFADDPLFRQALPAPPSGASRRTGILDQRAQIVAHVRLKGYPMVVAVSSSEDFVLASWRRDVWRVSAGAAGAIAFVAFALFFLMRQLGVSASLKHDLLETGERLRAIIHSAMDAVITVDREQRIVLFNEAAERIFLCNAEQAVGQPLDRFIPARFRAAHHRHVEHFGETGSTTRMMGANLVLYGLRGNGEEFPIDASISQIVVDGRKLYTVILRDITRRREAEEALQRSHQELRELSSAMHEVREAERLRIARELHDELAQWLTALKMDVSWLSARLPRDQAQLVEKTERMKGLVDTTVAAVRRIAADLRPAMLDDLGLVAALEGLLHDLSQRTGIVVSLDTGAGEMDFREPLASGLFRIAQEALTNVARHAQATEVAVSLRAEDGRIVLAVRDNGRGFDEEAAAQRKSYGVLGIRERAHTLGGTARILRLDAGGTLVEIVIPTARYRMGSSEG